MAALREMLTWPNDRFPEGMRAIEINAVKNDVLARLLRQIEQPEGIGLQMMEMAADVDNDPVWRDYCVQFMGPFYERAGSVGGGMSDVEGRSTSHISPSTKPFHEELEAVREVMVLRRASGRIF